MSAARDFLAAERDVALAHIINERFYSNRQYRRSARCGLAGQSF